MAIYDILSALEDRRATADGVCAFNGFLEDYLSILEDEEDAREAHAILSRLLEVDNAIRIVCDLHISINKEAIANQIIRYKDAFKLPEGAICCPYVLYGDFDGEQKALLLTLGGKAAYIRAKALYYVISEPENAYEGTRNEIIAMSVSKEHMDILLEGVEAFFHRHRKAGMVQRELDRKMFDSYEEMYELANHMAIEQREHLPELLKADENYESAITTIVATWFLLKKFSYVQYMMDKSTLQTEHEGSVKKQRQRAKEKSDAICFVSYSELWRMTKEL